MLWCYTWHIHLWVSLRNSQVTIQSNDTNFYFQRQCMKISIAPHPYQHLISSDLIFADWVRYYFPYFKFHFPISEIEYLIGNLHFLCLCVAFVFYWFVYLYNLYWFTIHQYKICKLYQYRQKTKSYLKSQFHCLRGTYLSFFICKME